MDENKENGVMFRPDEIGYVKAEPHLNLWISPNSRGEFAYSDGDEAEERVLAAIESCRDRSTFSAELKNYIVDWPSRYHLSSRRSALLHPIVDAIGGSVLEVGAGCGAISRFLGENGKDVIALEGSLRRSKIAATRCSDLPNVTVIAGEFGSFKPPQKFDCVLLVGVLEYARKYFPHNKDEDACDLILRSAFSMLEPNGKLVVAIENQLGLKYFAGYAEDHKGIPFFGLEGRYLDNDVVTFGKKELGDRLRSAGFSEQEWWYPFPDYKVPISIVSDEGLCSGGSFEFASLASRSVLSDPQRPSASLFSLQRVWHVVAKNGLLGQLSNSFLVVASGVGFERGGALAYHFSVDRKNGFNKLVEFSLVGGTVIPKKVPVNGQGLTGDEVGISLSLDDEQYAEGTLWHDELIKIVSSSGWNLGQVLRWSEYWWDAVLRIVGSDQDKKPQASDFIEGGMIDAIPRNLIKTEAGSVFIDQEWVPKPHIELGFLLYRGLADALNTIEVFASPDPSVPITVDQLIVDLAFGMGFWLSREDVVRFRDMEHQFQAKVAYVAANVDRPHFADREIPLIVDFRDLESLERAKLKLANELNRSNRMLEDTTEKLAALSDAALTIQVLRKERDQVYADVEKLRSQVVNLAAQLSNMHLRDEFLRDVATLQPDVPPLN